MGSKNRLVVSFVTVGIVILLGIIVLATWFFFWRYTFFSNITAQFKASKICGEVSANAIFAGQTYNMTVDGNHDGARKIIYEGDDVDRKEQLFVPNNKVFELNIRYDYVVLEYLFKNTSDDEEWLVNLKIDMIKDNNIAVTALYCEEGITDYTLIQDEYNDNYINRLPVATNNQMFVYIKIQISDNSEDAEFETNMHWVLNSRSYYNQSL